jgi:hypothetical protein
LSPVPAEAVYWVSARSDGWVVLLSLLAVLVWLDRRSTPLRIALALPLLLVVALGFKESAAVLPLQMVLVAWAWPARDARAQVGALIGAAAIVAAWFAMRAWLFGSVWHVYSATGTAANEPLWTFAEGVRSFPEWWAAQAAPRVRIADAYGILLGAGAVIAIAACRGGQARLAVAFAASGAGLLLATLLNVGLHVSGEGGRHFYAPAAWFALAVGVALCRPQPSMLEWRRHAALACVAAAAAVGSLLLHFKVEQVLTAQRHVRALTSALASWAATHAGLTMIIAAEREGPIVTLRNAQGALALPPLQARPLLHRTLPTLPRELPLRYEQFANGLQSRLETIAPAYLDDDVFAALAQRDAPRWPAVACWSATDERLIALPDGDAANMQSWTDSLLAAARRCGSADGR